MVSVCVCVCAHMRACSVVSDCVQPNGLYLPGSFVHGIFRARILEFIAIFYTRIPPRLEKNHVAPPPSQDEALSRYSASGDRKSVV